MKKTWQRKAKIRQNVSSKQGQTLGERKHTTQEV
jgi:hypothetical protein